MWAVARAPIHMYTIECYIIPSLVCCFWLFHRFVCVPIEVCVFVFANSLQHWKISVWIALTLPIYYTSSSITVTQYSEFYVVAAFFPFANVQIYNMCAFTNVHTHMLSNQRTYSHTTKFQNIGLLDVARSHARLRQSKRNRDNWKQKCIYTTKRRNSSLNECAEWTSYALFARNESREKTATTTTMKRNAKIWNDRTEIIYLPKNLLYFCDC